MQEEYFQEKLFDRPYGPSQVDVTEIRKDFYSLAP
jgi:hypothetical protein